MPKRLPASEYIEGILSGNRSILSRAITVIESTLESDAELASEIVAGCQSKAGNSFRLGITGVPGVGKSTFIDSFGMHLVKEGRKVAVLAVDPSSQISKGSILGDKTRMERLSHEPAAYVRPSPARGSLGGVTRSTRETILLCEAAGFDFIIVETVGVGQSEIAVHSMVDFFLLLMLAGAGDELQGIKKGIMEMADGISINKADADNRLAAKAARAEYESALHLFPQSQSGWIPKVLTCSALKEEGIDEILLMLDEYQKHTQASGWFDKKRQRQAKNWLHETIRNQLEKQFYEHPAVREALIAMEASVEAGELPPVVAANSLIDLYLQSDRTD